MNPRPGLPVFRRWVHDRRKGLLLLLVMSLCIFVTAFTSLFGDSLKHTLTEHRKNVYGAWQYAYLGLDAAADCLIRGNLRLAQTGEMVSIGTTVTPAAYGVGYAENGALELGRLQLLYGRYPKNTYETVIEVSAVRALGLNGEIGETFTLPVVSIDAKGDPVGDPQDQTYTLCGVLADYSAGWQITHQTVLPSILTAAPELRSTSGVHTLLLLGEADWELDEMENDLGGAAVGGRLIRNTYVYQTEPDPLDSSLRLIRRLGMLINGVAIVLVLHTVSNSRREEWRILLQLGADPRALRRCLLPEALGFTAVAMVLGTCLSLVTFRLLLPAAGHFLGFSLEMQTSTALLCSLIPAMALPVLLAYFQPCLILRQVIAGHRPVLRNRKKAYNRKCNRWELNRFRLILRESTGEPQRLLLEILLLAGILLIPCAGIRSMTGKVQELSGEEHNFGSSYTLEAMPSDDLNRKTGIDRACIPDVSDIYGVCAVTCTQMADPAQLICGNLSACTEEAYYAAAADSTRQILASSASEACAAAMEGLEKGLLPMSVLAPEDGLETLIKGLAEGSCSTEDLLTGETVLLYLPPLAVDPAKSSLYAQPCGTARQLRTARRNHKELIEETILQPGDRLMLSFGKNTRTVTIAGILRTLPASCVPSPYMPFTIICSSQLLKDLQWTSANAIQYIRVEASPEAGIGTDAQVSGMLYYPGTMNYENHRLRIENLKQEVYLQATLCLTLCGLAEFLLLFLLRLLRRVHQAAERESRQIFDCMGLPKSVRLLISGIEYLFCLVPTLATVTLGLSVEQYVTINRRLAELGQRVRFTFRVGFDRGTYLLLCLAASVIAGLMWGGGAAGKNHTRR